MRRVGALTIALTSVAYFMVALDTLAVVTALPSLHRDLGGGIGTLQWTVNAYNMAFGAGIITASALGDRLGRRRVYVVGLAVFTAASAACAVAPGLGALVAFRAIQGIGAAIVMPLGLTLLTSAFPEERRGAVIGIWGGVAGLAVAGGPLVGGAITQGLSWHWIFWVNLPVGLLAAVGARLRLRESHGPRTRLDLPALLLVTGGVAALIWGLVHAADAGWGGGTLAALGAGVVLLAGFAAWEARVTEPMIPPALFRVRVFSAAVTTQFLMASAIFAAAFLISQFFQLALGNSPLGTGLRFLPWTATPFLIAPLAGALSDRIGTRPLMVPGLLMQGIGFTWIAMLAGTATSYGGYVAPFLIAGVGVSMVIPCVSATALNAVPRPSLGRAAGVLNTTQQFGAVFGLAIVTAVFNATGGLTDRAAITDGFRPALGAAAGLSVLAAVAALGTGRRTATRDRDDRPQLVETVT